MKITICPYDSYDFAGREAWLADCAGKGLFIRWYLGPVFFMEQGEPKTLRFHIEPPVQTDDFQKQQEQTELFRQSGWEELCTFDGGLTVYCTADPAAIDPYTDDESRSMALEPLDISLRKYSKRRNLIWGILAAALLIVFTALGLFKALPTVLFSVPLSCTVWLIWSLVREIRSARRISRLRKALNEGRRPPVEKPLHPAAEVTYLALSALSTVCILLLLFGPGPGAFVPELPDLREIEAQEIQLKRESGDKNAFSIFAPIQYSEWQTASVPTERGTRGVSTLRMNYCLIIPALSEQIARAWLQLYDHELAASAAELEQYDIDMLLWAKKDDVTLLACANGGQLAVYYYYGEADLMEHLNVLTAPVR